MHEERLVKGCSVGLIQDTSFPPYRLLLPLVPFQLF